MAKAVQLKWKDIDTLCRKVTRAIKTSGFVPEIIVGIQRGGCIPAVFLLHLLGLEDFCTLGIRTTISEDIRASRQTPVIRDDFSLSLVKGKRVLLVDDVTNTGATLIVAKNRILEFGCRSLQSAVIAWDTIDGRSCQADFHAIKLNAWVIFPWEK